MALSGMRIWTHLPGSLSDCVRSPVLLGRREVLSIQAMTTGIIIYRPLYVHVTEGVIGKFLVQRTTSKSLSTEIHIRFLPPSAVPRIQTIPQSPKLRNRKVKMELTEVLRTIARRGPQSMSLRGSRLTRFGRSEHFTSART